MIRTRVVLVASLAALLSAAAGDFAAAEEDCLGIENTCQNTCANWGRQRGGAKEQSRCEKGCTDRAKECANRNAARKASQKKLELEIGSGRLEPTRPRR
jgi:hypothetical protein